MHCWKKVQLADAKRRPWLSEDFFGASAGVGKTFGMLLAARERRAEGLDVVAGYVETHKRAETEQLLQGLEILHRAWFHIATRNCASLIWMPRSSAIRR